MPNSSAFLFLSSGDKTKKVFKNMINRKWQILGIIARRDYNGMIFIYPAVYIDIQKNKNLPNKIKSFAIGVDWFWYYAEIVVY